MQRLEFSGEVQPIQGSLGVKGGFSQQRKLTYSPRRIVSIRHLVILEETPCQTIYGFISVCVSRFIPFGIKGIHGVGKTDLF
jgi:hypothetical protein